VKASAPFARPDGLAAPRVTWFWSLVLWSVPAVISVVHQYRWAASLRRPMSLWMAFASEAPPWYVLALITPPFLRFAVHEPLAWPPSLRVVLRHLAALAGASFAVVTVYTASWLLPRRHWTLAEFWNLYPVIWTDMLPKLSLAFIALYREAAATVHATAARRAERQRAALSVQLAQAQVQALEGQLHPHFLFNALDSVVALIREKDPERAAHAVIVLSEMLRSILSWRARGDDAISLEEELDFVRRYVELAEMRFEDRLRVTWSIEPGLAQRRVLPLSFQPLVENAFRHGLEKRRNAGLLVVGAREADGVLELFVEDDGPGPAAAPADGIGLSSTRARLREAYGDAASLALVARSGGGARASIRFPGLPPSARDD